MVQILSQIACLSVQELIFEFRTPDGIDFDWTFLANPLVDPKFDRPQVVRVEADIYSNDENIMVSVGDAWQVAERSIGQGAVVMQVYSGEVPLRNDRIHTKYMIMFNDRRGVVDSFILLSSIDTVQGTL